MTPPSQQQGAGQVLEALYTRYTDGSLTAEWLRRRSCARNASPSIASLRSAAHVADSLARSAFGFASVRSAFGFASGRSAFGFACLRPAFPFASVRPASAFAS